MAKKQKFDYFDGFYRQAQTAVKESQALVELLEDYQPESEEWTRVHFNGIHSLENEGDQITHEILGNLATEFMPPIDREDVTELCKYLDDVCDLIEEVVQHLYMFDIKEIHPYAIEMAKIIDEEVDALAEATGMFREFKKPKKLEGLLVAVHDKESEADLMYLKAKRDLFSNHADAPAAYLIAWNSTFSHMEACCDACEDVATVMQKVMLKNT